MKIQINATVRRMIHDREFAEAITQLVQAQDHLRDIESREREVRAMRNIGEVPPRKLARAL